MNPKDRIAKAINTLTELWDELEPLALDSLKSQSEKCQEHAELAAHAVALALEHMEHARDYYDGKPKAVPDWTEDTAVLPVLKAS